MKQAIKTLSAGALLALSVTSAAADRIDLKQECERVFKVYPLLMLAVMAESPMNCGDPGTDEFVDCDANETPEEKAAHARRLEVRKHQEAAYEPADKVCKAWIKAKKSQPLRDSAERAVAEARAADNWRPTASVLKASAPINE